MNRLDVLDSLNMAKAALSTFDVPPILTHFVFEDGIVRAYNDVMAIEVPIDGVEIECALPGSMLTKLLSSLKTDEISLTDMGDGHVEVKSGRSKFSLPTLSLDTDLFAVPSDLDSPKMVCKLSTSFLRGLAKCMTSVGTDLSQEQELGVTLVQKGKCVSLFSTNNRAISKYSLKLDTIDGELPKGLLMPTEFCKNLIRITDTVGDEDTVLKASPGWLWAEIDGGDILLFSKVPLEEYDQKVYDFPSMLDGLITDDDIKNTCEVPEEFFSALDRASQILSTEVDKEVDIDIDGVNVHVSSASKYAEGDETCEFKNDMGEMSFSADPSLLLRAGKVANRVRFLPNVVLFAEGSFLQLVTHVLKD